MTEKNQRTLSVSDAKSIEDLNTITEQSMEIANALHECYHGKKDFTDYQRDNIDQEFRAHAIAIKSIMSKAHLSNASQRIIENSKLKQIK